MRLMCLKMECKKHFAKNAIATLYAKVKEKRELSEQEIVYLKKNRRA